MRRVSGRGLAILFGEQRFMRIRSSAVAAGRLALALIVVVGSVVLLSAPKPHFSQHDKAYYADQNLVNFVRPGLVIKIVSA
jgi:hypothetical protein